MRKNDFQNWMRIYYEQLSENIALMGSDPEKLFSFDDLQNELKNSGNIILLRGAILLQISLTKTEDSVDLTDMCEREENFDLVQNTNQDFDNIFGERLSGILDDILEMGAYRRVD